MVCKNKLKNEGYYEAFPMPRTDGKLQERYLPSVKAAQAFGTHAATI
jgi:hypothetical protein